MHKLIGHIIVYYNMDEDNLIENRKNEGQTIAKCHEILKMYYFFHWYGRSIIYWKKK